MAFRAYRAVLALPDVRRILLLGFVVRVPLFAGTVILTLHVVSTLGHSYAASGLVLAVATVALSVSAPWRGRLLDRVGLRTTIAPSLVVLAVCWSVAPFVSYWPLLVLAGIAGLFAVPTFSIVRQVLIGAVPDHQRTTSLAVDSVVVELSFMVGPTLGVLLATYCPTSWAVFACEFASIAGGALIWLIDPPLNPPVDPPTTTAPGPSSAPGTEPATAPPRLRDWLDVRTAVVLATCVATTLVLTGTDVGVVAALRDMGHQSWVGWELAVWGAGSAIGGLVYGALRRPPSLPVLLGLLSVMTLPPALTTEPVLLAVLLFAAGACCAPTITASVDALSRVVPPAVRGEAMGWHGSALTAGSALGAPIAGVAIDHAGWRGGFVLPAALGLLLAIVAHRTVRTRAPAGAQQLDELDTALSESRS